MKTKQEQIEEIQEIIGDSYEYDSISAELGSGDGYVNTEEAAKAIVEAGYGDVSEHKAEIGRLKAEYEQLQTNAEILARGVRDLNHENYELTNKVKQAQIDVLNKVKEHLYAIYITKSAPLGDITVEDIADDIDELIEEVEK